MIAHGSNVPLNAILRPVQAIMTAASPPQSWSPSVCTSGAAPPTTVSSTMSRKLLKSWSWSAGIWEGTFGSTDCGGTSCMASAPGA